MESLLTIVELFLELLNEKFIAVHMVHLNEADINLVQQTHCHVVHCPESNLKLASGFCPLQKLFDAGINVALGTDGAASNNDLDMFAELRTATLLGKAIAGDPTAAQAHRMLEMATLGGARALGLDEVCGSLVAGKAADMIAIDLSALELQPVHDPIAHLIYNIHSHHVSDVWVEGQALVHNGQWLSIDIEECRSRAAHWRMRVAEVLKG